MNGKVSKKTLEMLGFVRAEPVLKGWSGDEKYCAETKDGTRYLLRFSPAEKAAGRKAVFSLQKKAEALGVPMCRPIAFGECEEGVYTVQTWIHGEDARDALPLLPDVEQYLYGLRAGRILRKIHSIPAPEDQPDWETRFNQKIDRKIAMCRACPIQFDGAEEMIAYIQENRHLLKDRPQAFQHGDYHIGNMMLENGELVIIDFDRFDFGDPWEEFNRITWCAQESPFMATGLVNGYFEGEEVPEDFWRLLAVYIFSNMLSSVAWAIPFGQQEIDTMLRQAAEVMEWYENVTRIVPAWYMGQVYIQRTDGVPYRLKEPFDFGFLEKYGRVFKVYDDQDSGNICFGLEKDGQRVFLKFAGAPTYRGSVSREEAVDNLKKPVHLYRELAHENLIELLEEGEMGGGYGVLFRWTDGISMGRMYPKQHRAFMALPAEIKQQIFKDILNFHIFTADKGYAAVDLYDSTVMYDRKTGKTVLCDIDFYRKAPFDNEMGRLWGSSLFMSPEEFTRGGVIDEITNVYTLGAMAFALFGGYSRKKEDWTLSPALFAVAEKAVQNDKKDRYPSLRALPAAWKAALKE